MAAGPGRAPLIEKPFSPETLLRMLRQALGKS